MYWFIFSEVMFFAAFFGALFYTRNLVAVPWLGWEKATGCLHPRPAVVRVSVEVWPTNGPEDLGGSDFDTMGCVGHPWR